MLLRVDYSVEDLWLDLSHVGAQCEECAAGFGHHEAEAQDVPHLYVEIKFRLYQVLTGDTRRSN